MRDFNHKRTMLCIVSHPVIHVYSNRTCTFPKRCVFDDKFPSTRKSSPSKLCFCKIFLVHTKMLESAPTMRRPQLSLAHVHVIWMTSTLFERFFLNGCLPFTQKKTGKFWWNVTGKINFVSPNRNFLGKTGFPQRQTKIPKRNFLVENVLSIC